jgi:hypothetical protein
MSQVSRNRLMFARRSGLRGLSCISGRCCLSLLAVDGGLNGGACLGQSGRP